jgi:hypothetical protein
MNKKSVPANAGTLRLLFYAMHYGFSSLDCPNLLTHEDRVAYAKAKKRDRHQRHHVGHDDGQALKQGQGALKPG